MNVSRQLAVWTQGEIVNEVAKQRYSKQQQKSEKRQRTDRVTVRLLPSERAALMSAARSTGVSLAAFIRTTALQHSTPDTHEAEEQG